ncbi:MAG: hypothetical protein ACYDCX_13170 [Acidithiobacillus sp.]
MSEHSLPPSSSTPEHQDSSLAGIEARCVALYQLPSLQGKGWLPNLFWRRAADGDLFGSLRVDPWELEVLFAAVAGVPSLARPILEAQRPGRAAFIARSIAHGELPYLRYADGGSTP